MQKIKLLMIPAVAMAIAIPTLAFAAQQKFKLERGTVQIEVPESWQTAEGLFGLPLIVLGPEGEESRPSIAVIPIGANTQVFDPVALKSGGNTYKAGREAWLKKYQGRSLAYLPYSEAKLNDTAVAHSIGYRYQIGDRQFVEKSYYVACKEKLYHLKTLMSSTQETTQSKTVDQMIASFTCE